MPVALGLALITLPSLLGMVTAGSNVLSVDLRISRAVQQWQGRLPDELQRIGDVAGSTRGAVLALVVCLAVSLIARWKHGTTFVLIVTAFRIAGIGLKSIFDSPRPTEDLVALLHTYNHTGYPSGHSMTMAMIAATVATLIWRHIESTSARWTSIIVGILFTILVGWSRIWAGAHWPTDVLGGWMYGVGFVLLAAGIAFRPRLGKHHLTSNPVA